jgi:hypothetical protein
MAHQFGKRGSKGYSSLSPEIGGKAPKGALRASQAGSYPRTVATTPRLGDVGAQG